MFNFNNLYLFKNKVKDHRLTTVAARGYGNNINRVINTNSINYNIFLLIIIINKVVVVLIVDLVANETVHHQWESEVLK